MVFDPGETGLDVTSESVGVEVVFCVRVTVLVF